MWLQATKLLEVFLGEWPTSGRGVRPHLLWLGRTGDDRHDAFGRGECADRELVERVTLSLGEASESLETVVLVFLDHATCEPRAFGRRLATPVFPCEQTTCKREVRDVRDPELPAERENILVVVAAQKVVVVLEDRETGSPALPRDAVGLDELPGREVRTSNRAHLPALDELVERTEGVADRYLRVGAVHVVEVDMVGSQPFERALDRPANRLGRREALARLPGKLRRENDAVPLSVEDLSEQPLATAPVAVDLGGVEERHAHFERGVDDGARLFEAEATAEVVAAETNTRDAQPTLVEFDHLHRTNAIERPRYPRRVTHTRTLLEQLVAIESVNPTLVPGGGGEAQIGRFVAGWLERNGVETEYEELAPSRANVVGRVRGTGGGRSLMLNAHMDTVGLGGPDGALTPREEQGRLYGRGSYDMKGSLAAMMLAAAAAAELRLSGDLIITAVADEEALSIGSERIAESVQADAAIVTEPTGLDIAVAHRGFVWLELETHGRAEHGSRYDLGIDAIARMGAPLVALGELDRRFDDEGEAHPLLGRASAHASLIEGGTELSTYPDRCLLKVERRTLPGETVDQVKVELREIAPNTTVEATFSREPLETPTDAAIVELLARKAADVLGTAPRLIGVPFWTDAALYAAAGIPTVVFGPGGGGAHAETEWVELEDVERLVQILLATATEFCRTETS